MPKANAIQDDCFAHDKDRLRHNDALAILKKNLTNITSMQTIPLVQANGRILAQSIIAPHNVPNHDNSAVDGYAFRHEDFEKSGGFFPITSRIAAGDSEIIELPQESAARIFTGALTPINADTIVMQEDCELHQQVGVDFVIVPPGLKCGANLRRAGEDVEKDSEILKPGARLTPADIAALASFGIEEVEVYGKLRIALASTGDEIIRPGETLKQGQVYDANHYMISALMENLPVEITDLGILPDTKQIVEKALKTAFENHDIIITSGGVSKGEEDHVMNFLDENGNCQMWQLAIKPGRPMCFGQVGNTVFFGLPGNPVASFVCCLLYIYPALLCLGGSPWPIPRHYQIPANFDVPSKKPDRREFWRGSVVVDEDGQQRLQKFARDGSGLISGLREADGLIEIAEDVISVNKGDLLKFIPFSEFGII